MSDGREGTTRRRLLRTLGAASTGALAGCPAFSGDDDRTRTFGVPETSTEPGRWTTLADGPPALEVLHRWRAGQGRRAYEALLRGFRADHPDVEFIDTTRTTGLDYERVVRDRLREGTPPSTWQAYPGANLYPYAGAGVFRNLAPLWDRTGLAGAVPADLRTTCSLNGSPVTVPLSVHRVNTVFANRAVLNDAGVSLGAVDSPAALRDACAAVADRTDAVPLAHSTQSATGTVRLFASLLLAGGGPERYRRTTAGAPEEGTVRAALDHLSALRSFFPADADRRDWFELLPWVVDGRAAFAVLPDWGVDGFGSSSIATGGDDWDVVAFPGTAGLFVPFVDTFPFPTDNPTPDGTTAFLEYLAGEGQGRFCGVKGSIPPRTDVDPETVDGVTPERLRSYSDARAHPPSLAYGAAVRPTLTREVAATLQSFLSTGDVTTATSSLVSTFSRAFA